MENNQKLNDVTVAVLMADGFEQVEFTKPREALLNAGAKLKVVSLKSGKVKGWDETDWGESFDVDQTVADAQADDFDALLLPGGVLNPDKLRNDDGALTFVKAFFEAGKPVAAICHGPQTLISAGLCDGREMTGFSSIQVDLKNAGATVHDKEVVTDQGLVTSRNPDDLPAFCAKMVEEFAEGKHAGQMASVS